MEVGTFISDQWNVAIGSGVVVAIMAFVLLQPFRRQEAAAERLDGQRGRRERALASAMQNACELLQTVIDRPVSPGPEEDRASMPAEERISLANAAKALDEFHQLLNEHRHDLEGLHLMRCESFEREARSALRARRLAQASRQDWYAHTEGQRRRVQAGMAADKHIGSIADKSWDAAEEWAKQAASDAKCARVEMESLARTWWKDR
jgi:hypothetical protein